MTTNSPAMEGKARSFWEGVLSVFIPPPPPIIRHKSSDEIVVEISGKLHVVNLDDQSWSKTDADAMAQDWENVMKGLSRAVEIDAKAFEIDLYKHLKDKSLAVPGTPKTVTKQTRP